MTGDPGVQRVRVVIRGAVQGVGFRPFVYRLAEELGLQGWVNNSPHGVFVEAEGSRELLDSFLAKLRDEKPAISFIQSFESTFLEPAGYGSFEIRKSSGGAKTALIMPDLTTCPDCRREIFDPGDRRYRYPFTNCTNCGPRFSIIEALPYDRPNTTMKRFVMCEACREEYENPADRRFHAQPNACPECGPHLELRDASGKLLAEGDEALLVTAGAVRDGRIVAVKGLGGFHLVVDARDDAAVRRLRERKGREEKPFAMMLPDLDGVLAICAVSEAERRLITDPASPIVLLERAGNERKIAESVAPANPTFGVMLPYTPLHHLLMAELGFAVVATSGNLTDEPICTDEREALTRLGEIADLFLVHDRPIARHVDDSIGRVIAGRELIMRRARGYAPLPVRLRRELPPVLAVGGHLKNTVALSVGADVFLSQHIGDLETPQAESAFREVIDQFRGLYESEPLAIAHDLHPDYHSTGYARKQGINLVAVQHHYAHVLACMAENEIEGPVLGVSWDGTGYGPDGTVWGGEFLLIGEHGGYERVASFRTFPLPGGEKAVREPRRAALGLLYEMFGEAAAKLSDLPPLAAFRRRELPLLFSMLEKGINAPRTSSVGRLFDAAASLAGLRQVMSYEGQAAMEFEYTLHGVDTDDAYQLVLNAGGDGPRRIDWEPMFRAIIDDLHRGTGPGVVSARVHNSFVEAIIEVARGVGVEHIALTGGCFQNRYLTERSVARLGEERFKPLWHQRIPPNDAGIALGQVVAAAHLLHGDEKDVSGGSGQDKKHIGR